MVNATWASEQNGNVLATAPAEEGKTVVEEGGERHASGESFVIESERAACHPVRTNEALVFVHSEEQRGRGVVGRQSGDDPCMAEVLAEETLFDGACGRDGCGEGQLLRAIRAFGGDGGDVQHASEFAESIKDRGAGAGEFAVARAIVLAAMDEQGALFGDAGADAVGAFDLLGPDAAEPDAPAFEIVGAGFIAAMVNRDSSVVAQEDDVALLADDGVKTIDLFSCVNDDVGDGIFRGF